MTILQKYIVRSYVSAFVLGMVVLTFVLTIGLLVKATQLVIKGLEPQLILNFLAVSIPETFSFTIPLAVLVSALLVFGRLSSDGEMSAMKACGINLWTVVFPMVLFGIALSALSVFVNSSIAPRGYHARHLIASSAKGSSAIKLLEPGRFIEEFPNMTFWFARKDGDLLHNVLIYDKSKPDFTREIRAEKAVVTVEGNDITLDMYNARIDPFSENQPGAATVGRMVHTIRDAVADHEYRPKVGGHLNGELKTMIADLSVEIDGAVPEIKKREARLETARREAAELAAASTEADAEALATSNRLAAASAEADAGALVTSNRFAAAEPPSNGLEDNVAYTNALAAYTNAIALAAQARADAEEAGNKAKKAELLLAQGKSFLSASLKKRSEMQAELSRRFALGFAPVVFMLIGIPLGMRTSRKESNIGVAISMGVMILYYAFLIIAKSLSKRPEFYPHVIIWIPSAVCLAISVLLIRRNQ